MAEEKDKKKKVVKPRAESPKAEAAASKKAATAKKADTAKSGKAVTKPKKTGKPAEAVTAEKAAETKAVAPEKPVTQKAKKVSKKSGDYVPRLKVYYNEKVIPFMIDKFSYANPNMVPKIGKISINSRVSTARDEVKDLESVVDDITVVAGQKAVVTRAKKAIANFKIRQGDPVGATVTIRGRRMYEFLDRMISIAIPRVRDFNGLREKSFDGFGNYSFGVKEQIIFPEIDYDKVDKIRGMDITIVTTASTDEEGYELLKSLGMPFRNIETAETGN